MWMAVGIGPDEMHIVPHNDLVEHTTDDECICGPETEYLHDGLKVVIHSSLDGRERHEPDWKG